MRAEDLWLEFLVVDMHCGLCGNSGVVDTRFSRHLGGMPGVRTFCICPNGRTLREQDRGKEVPVIYHTFSLCQDPRHGTTHCGVLVMGQECGRWEHDHPQHRRINSFTGEYRFLSNFYPSHVEAQHPDTASTPFRTVEHAYQASKCRNLADFLAMSRLDYPGAAKRWGQHVEMWPWWEERKLTIMGALLRQKFRDPVLRLLLVGTGSAHLEEGNTWGDRFWGTVDGVGENHLGRLLMRIREECDR